MMDRSVAKVVALLAEVALLLLLQGCNDTPSRGHVSFSTAPDCQDARAMHTAAFPDSVNSDIPDDDWNFVVHMHFDILQSHDFTMEKDGLAATPKDAARSKYRMQVGANMPQSQTCHLNRVMLQPLTFSKDSWGADYIKKSSHYLTYPPGPLAQYRNVFGSYTPGFLQGTSSIDADSIDPPLGPIGKDGYNYVGRPFAQLRLDFTDCNPTLHQDPNASGLTTKFFVVEIPRKDVSILMPLVSVFDEALEPFTDPQGPDINGLGSFFEGQESEVPLNHDAEVRYRYDSRNWDGSWGVDTSQYVHYEGCKACSDDVCGGNCDACGWADTLVRPLPLNVPIDALPSLVSAMKSKYEKLISKSSESPIEMKPSEMKIAKVVFGELGGSLYSDEAKAQRKLIAQGVLALLLCLSFVFIMVQWSSIQGDYEKDEECKKQGDIFEFPEATQARAKFESEDGTFKKKMAVHAKEVLELTSSSAQSTWTVFTMLNDVFQVLEHQGAKGVPEVEERLKELREKFQSLREAPPANCPQSRLLRDGTKIKQLVEANNIEGLKAAADEGYDISDIGESYTSLHWAACDGNLEMLKVIVGNGQSVFAVSGGGHPKTVLQVAAKYGHRHVCEYLVANGLDPHEVDVMTSDFSNRPIESWSAVRYAHEKGRKMAIDRFGPTRPIDLLAQWLDEQPAADFSQRKEMKELRLLLSEQMPVFLDEAKAIERRRESNLRAFQPCFTRFANLVSGVGVYVCALMQFGPWFVGFAQYIELFDGDLGSCLDGFPWETHIAYAFTLAVAVREMMGLGCGGIPWITRDKTWQQRRAIYELKTKDKEGVLHKKWGAMIKVPMLWVGTGLAAADQYLDSMSSVNAAWCGWPFAWVMAVVFFGGFVIQIIVGGWIQARVNRHNLTRLETKHAMAKFSIALEVVDMSIVLKHKKDETITSLRNRENVPKDRFDEYIKIAEDFWQESMLKKEDSVLKKARDRVQEHNSPDWKQMKAHAFQKHYDSFFQDTLSTVAALDAKFRESPAQKRALELNEKGTDSYKQAEEKRNKAKEALRKAEKNLDELNIAQEDAKKEEKQAEAEETRVKAELDKAGMFSSKDKKKEEMHKYSEEKTDAKLKVEKLTEALEKAQQERSNHYHAQAGEDTSLKDATSEHADLEHDLELERAYLVSLTVCFNETLERLKKESKEKGQTFRQNAEVSMWRQAALPVVLGFNPETGGAVLLGEGEPVFNQEANAAQGCITRLVTENIPQAALQIKFGLEVKANKMLKVSVIFSIVMAVKHFVTGVLYFQEYRQKWAQDDDNDEDEYLPLVTPT